MRELLDAETFRYFLMSQVDFCVTSTASYLPIIAFEVDSPYHDRPEQQDRDRKKNENFSGRGSAVAAASSTRATRGSRDP